MSIPAILVADEDFDTRVILRTVLERQNFVVVEATTADAAIAAAESTRFELVILNYPMFTQHGRTLVECLRESPNSRSCPILNLTSRVVPKFLEQADRQGVSLTMPKPIDVEALLRVVGQLTRTAAISAH